MADNASNALEFNLLSLIFNATSYAGLWDNDQSSPLTYLSVQLHTASPGETGDLVTNEAAYTGYARVGVERTSSGWTVAGSTSVTGSVKPTTTIVFPAATAGTTALVTHFSIGNSTVAASTGIMYVYGAVSPNISVSDGVTPRLTTATAITLI
jgi:hypothetical protein